MGFCSLRVLGAAWAAGLLLCAGIEAQVARELDYQLLSSNARLTAEGSLEIDERHLLVMTGAWNGAERRFRLGRGQSLTMVRVSRWDPVARAEIPMTRDPSVASVDSWTYAENTFRMRARAPEAPPLDREIVAYRIVYRIDGVLEEKRGGRYELDHDFAFGDRDGPIRRFNLNLEIDPQWRAGEPLAAPIEETDLPVGSGYVVKSRFEYVGDNPPNLGAKDDFQEGVFLALLALLLGGMAWLRVAQPERFAAAQVDVTPAKEQKLLRELRVKWTPEQCAVLWPQGGDNLGETLVLRLVGEGRIEHLSDADGGGERLRLGREGKEDTEAVGVLLDKVFLGEEEIRLSVLRRHYRRTGLNLSQSVRKQVEAEVDELVRTRYGAPLRKEALVLRRWVPILLGIVASSLFVAEAVVQGAGSAAIGELLMVAALLSVAAAPALWLALAAAKRSFGVGRWAGGFAALCLLPICVAAISGFIQEPSYLAHLAHFCLGAAALLMLFGRFHGRQARGFARSSLDLAPAQAALRARFARGKDLPEPLLPYAGAFGLLSSRGEWARIAPEFDPDDPRHRRRDVPVGGSSASAGGAVGGGGAFGGAGASGAWAVASGFASVSRPTSSGSSGSSSGSSSGGGGGGGW